MRFLTRLFACVVLSLSAALVHATIAPGLQMQLGNPSLASTDTAASTNFLLDRAQMALSFNDTTRDPNWVSWDLTNADVGAFPRGDFTPDPDLPAGFHALTKADYNGVGNIHFDRGHMTPSKDRTNSQENNDVVFYMTNIVPQAADNNQGPWEDFETECRSIAAQGNELLIVSGPSGFGVATIPSGLASIPSFTWKVVVVVPNGAGSALSRINASTRVIAIKLPNVNGIRSVPWTDYILSAAEIEADTGYNLFRAVEATNPALANILRAKIDSGATTPAGAPTILTQPAAQTTVLGGPASFFVAASGSSLLYQWEKDGLEINGATGPTLALANVQAADAGSYRVTISNAAGSVISNPATLTVSDPVEPKLGTLAGVTALAGTNATFTVAITGGVPTPSIQWFQVGNPTAIATGNSLVLANVQSAVNHTFYYAVATNFIGGNPYASFTSNTAELIVTPVAPSIATQPQSQSVVPGTTNVSFSVVASGSSPLSYQWRKNGAPIGGATASTFTIGTVQTTDAGSYDVLVSNDAGAVASNLAILAIAPVGSGDIFWNFGTTASNANATSNGSNGTTSGAFTFGNSFGNNTTPFGTSTASPSPFSGQFNLGVPCRPGAISKAANGSAYFEITFTPPAGQTAVFTNLSFASRSTATGPQAFVVTSSKDNYVTDLGTGTMPNNTNWNGYNVPLFLTSSVPVTFRIYGYNGTSNAQSGTVTWKIDDVRFTVYATAGAIVPPTVAIASTAPAANANNVPVNSTIGVTFNTPVTPTGAWFAISGSQSGAITATANPAAGSSGTTFTFTPSAPLKNSETITTTIFANQLSATGQPGATLSSNFTFAFNTVPPTAPSITQQPRPQNDLLVGGSVTLSVTATGTQPLSYQWYKGPLNGTVPPAGALVPNATGSSLTLSNVTLADAGDYYVVIDNAAVGTLASNVAHVNVTLTPVPVHISTAPVSQSVASGAASTATFTVVADGSAPFAYQWFKDGTPVGTNSDTLTVTNITPASAGTYSVTVSNSGPNSFTSSDSAAATLTVLSSAGLSMRDYHAGEYVPQNFDTLPSSGSFTFTGSGPFGLDNATGSNGVGATGALGWSFAAAGTPRFTPDAGTNTTGSAISYGNTGDRALGSIASGSSAAKFGLVLVNRTGTTLNQFSVRFVGEQWRRGGSGTANTLAFSYAVGTDVVSAADASYTLAPALNFNSPNTVGAGGALDGNTAANRTSVLAQVTGITWAPNQVLVLRWTDKDDGGADDGLGLDDFVFTTEALAAPTVTAPASLSVPAFTPATFSVSATGAPAAFTYQWFKGTAPIVGANGASYTIASATAADAGSYSCVVTNIAGSTTSAAASLAVTKVHADVALSNLTATYDGNPHAVTATPTPGNLNVSVTYDNAATAPTNAGSYAVVATIDDANYFGSASDTLVIAPAHADITLGGLAQTYNGSLRSVTTGTTPANLNVEVVYTGTPLNAGSYPFTATIHEQNYAGAVSGTLVISPAHADITLGGLSQVYTGAPLSVTTSTTPANLNLEVVYTGGHTNVGSYPFTATIHEQNYAGSASGTLVITPAHADVTLADLTQTYSGSPKSATVTTTPAGLATNVTYDGGGAPTNAGSYHVVATIADPNYSGGNEDTFTIQQLAAGVTLSHLNQTYDGTAKSATATTSPIGLTVELRYDGSLTPPTAAGSYAVLATIHDTNRFGSATGTLVIAKASTDITLSALTLPYDGTPRVVTGTTSSPAGLTVNVTYNGSATPPVYPGAYEVVATIDDANYSGSITDTLHVGTTALVNHAPSLQGELYGSLQVRQPESFTLNGGALVSGDLLVTGLPTVRLNGTPTYAGTVDASGSDTPANYQVTLNGNVVLRHLVRRVDAIPLPAVSAPPAPAGTRNVSVNNAQGVASIGDFSTVRNLTLNGNVGDVAVPAGTYGALTANASNSFTFGDASATEPVVYNLQSLTLNGTAQLRVVGRVVINLANGLTVNAGFAAAADPASVALNVANGGVTLNGSAVLHGNVNAPNGTISINGSSTLVGTVTADRLTLNGNAELRAP